MKYYECALLFGGIIIVMMILLIDQDSLFDEKGIDKNQFAN